VREAGDILGVSDKVKNRGNPKAIIRFILEQIINFKKMN
jgi:intraflagellar transport protein 52